MEIRDLAQAATRRLALALAGLTALAGLLHTPMLPIGAFPWILSVGLLSASALLAMAGWLRKPRPLPWVNGAAAGCALLASAAGLLVLGLSRDLHHTLDLALVLVGAGAFMPSQLWFAVTCLFTGTGWALLVVPRSPQAEVATFAVALVMAGLMGWVLNRARRQIFREFERLHTRDQEREAQLLEALEGIKTLRGLVPICAQCKKIRDDQGFWQQVETYVHEHSEAEFTHSLCPTCAEAVKAEWEALLPPESEST